MSITQLTIIEPNGVQRQRPLTPQGLTIGRDVGNDLLITYDMVSRHHAQVIFDQGYYYVVDLSSGNGTYLGNTQLQPNQPAVWQPGQPLRIGNVIIHMGQSEAQTPAPAPLVGPDGEPYREKDETASGVVWPGAQPEQKSGSNRTLWLVMLLFAALCGCSCLASAVYGYFYWV